MVLDELIINARYLKIPGYPRLKKQDLINAIKSHISFDKPVDTLNIRELKIKAKEMKLIGYSCLSKHKLIDMIKSNST